MEVIQNVSKTDINSSIMRIKKNITKNFSIYSDIINSAEIDLQQKQALLDEFEDKLKVYNKVLTVLVDMINEYCTENKITVYKKVMSDWLNTYKTPWNCTTDNVVYDEIKLSISDPNDIHIYCNSCDTCQGCQSCQSCQGCQTCNSAQTTCGASYYSSTGCGNCNSCQSGYNSCSTCQSCNSCQTCNTSCDSGYNLTFTCLDCQSGF